MLTSPWFQRGWLPALSLLLVAACYDKGAGVHPLKSLYAAGSSQGGGEGRGSASRPGSRPTSRPAVSKIDAQSERKTDADTGSEPGRAKPRTQKPKVKPEGVIPSTEPLAPVLSRIVKGARVDYQETAKHRAVLDAYLAGVAKANLTKASKKEKLAFYINAYNVSTLTQVLDRIIGKAAKGRDYKGVLAVKGFFDNKSVLVSGVLMSLNELEAKGRALGDPRIHFAVNCASVSCPALMNRPWRVATLEEDLEQATRKHFATKEGLVLDGGIVKVTQLQNWYAKDFGGKDGALRFARRYAPAAARSALESGIDGYLTYNWNLNKK